VVAEDSGAAHFDLLGPPGWCSGCWPHDGEVDGCAVEIFCGWAVLAERPQLSHRLDLTRQAGFVLWSGASRPVSHIDDPVGRAAPSRGGFPLPPRIPTFHARPRTRRSPGPPAQSQERDSATLTRRRPLTDPDARSMATSGRGSGVVG
jgi:hypothetical protein